MNFECMSAARLSSITGMPASTIFW